MYITKTIAEQVAKQLMTDKIEELKKAKTALEKYVERKYLESIPQDLLETFEKFKHHGCFKLSGSTRFICEGVENWKWYYFKNSLIDVDKTPKLTKSESKELLQLETVIDKIERKNNQLKYDLVAALVNIKTYKNCQKVFPKAFALLPSKTTTAVAVNLNKILAELN